MKKRFHGATSKSDDHMRVHTEKRYSFLQGTTSEPSASMETEKRVEIVQVPWRTRRRAAKLFPDEVR
jgi:hypothetical protein